jgi:hypothetical protein
MFDPTANMRAFSAIQADGFRAASELVDRFVRIASSGLNGIDRSTTPPASEQSRDLFGATGLEPYVASWWSMVDQFVRMAAPRAPEPASAATVELSTGEVKGRIQLEAVVPGAANAEVWLHNVGPADLGEVRLRCSDLLAHDGTTIPAGMLRFDPDVVPMPARSSRGVSVEAEVGDDHPPGSYRGTLLADGHPDVWLPIELTIKTQES